jgi:hypothetical protein
MTTKTCKICLEEKLLSYFPSSGYYTDTTGVRKKSYKPECKPCLVSKQRNNYERLWNKYFKPVCSRCGYDKCRAALEVHHTISETKEFTFAQRWSISESKFAAEAVNCIVLCANCHRELHEELKGD